jgi:hypothetical protein
LQKFRKIFKEGKVLLDPQPRATEHRIDPYFFPEMRDHSATYYEEDYKERKER